MFCPLCGKEIPEAYAGVRCPSCGGSLTAGAAGGGGPVPPSAPAPGGIPWENRASLGFFPALLQNIRSCLFEPDSFFGRMPKRANLGSALGYVALLGWVGVVAGSLWDLALRERALDFARSMGFDLPQQTLSPAFQVVGQIMKIVLAPLLVLIVVFLWSGILHVCLWVFGGAREGFEATVRVVSYAWGSAAPFYLVPICGGFVALVWSLVGQIIGLAKAHEIPPGKAAVAVLLPLALCCVVAGICILLFAGIFFAALKGGGA
ncbi:MAG TPA: YIP1 family protein [Candidatus Polarisedimenticolia bacterium]|jgi:hypothetical protein|nr:YIP1 family protein [Candidatus Polarisedimenticolia bacterium]